MNVSTHRARQQTRSYAHAQADGFGIGWYSPENDAKPIIPGTVTSPHSHPTTPGIPGTPGENVDHEKDDSLPNGGQNEDGELLEDEVVQALELLKVRQHEAELENERPCVFKSISPVSSLCWSKGFELTLGMEQREPDSTSGEDQESPHLVSCAPCLCAKLMCSAHVRASTMAGARGFFSLNLTD
jgi:hypothetical protein